MLEGDKLATLADVENRKDFAKTVAYYRSVITNHRENHSCKPDVNIAGFGSGRGGRGGQNKICQGRDCGRHGQKREANGNRRNRTPVPEDYVELKHYNTKLYSDLTPGQKSKLSRLREEDKAEGANKGFFPLISSPTT